MEPLLAALGGALALGLDLDDGVRGISRLRRTGLKGEVHRLRDNIVVYDDSYNASPAAVAAVLRYGAQQAGRQDRRLVAVLGGMFELGATARAYHQEAGRIAEEAGVDLLVCVGDEARWYAEAFSARRSSTRTRRRHPRASKRPCSPGITLSSRVRGAWGSTL